MASEIANAKDGLLTRLATISAIRSTFDYPPDGLNEFPSAVVQFQGRDVGQQGMGESGTFIGEFVMTLLISSAATKQAFDELDAFMEPDGTNSVEAAINSDNTWNSSVDDGRLTGISSIGFREVGGGRYVAADFNFTCMKTV